MKIVNLLLSLIISGFVISGCNVLSQYTSTFDIITQKTSIEDFTTLYKYNWEPYTIKANSSDYTVYSINLNTSRADKTSQINSKIIFYQNRYFFIFYNNYYFYSGFLYEFLNSNEQNIKNIGAELRIKLIKEEEGE